MNNPNYWANEQFELLGKQKQEKQRAEETIFKKWIFALKKPFVHKNHPGGFFKPISAVLH
jgi:hypothetical protein